MYLSGVLDWVEMQFGEEGHGASFTEPGSFENSGLQSAQQKNRINAPINNKSLFHAGLCLINSISPRAINFGNKNKVLVENRVENKVLGENRVENKVFGGKPGRKPGGKQGKKTG